MIDKSSIASKYNVPESLAAIISVDVIRMAHASVKRKASSGKKREYMMISALKHITDVKSLNKYERGIWQIFWERWEERDAPLTAAQREKCIQEEEEREAQEKKQRGEEMRAARDLYIKEKQL